MNRNFIGNERQLSDNTIAVLDAVSLSECYELLHARLVEMGLSQTDYYDRNVFAVLSPVAQQQNGIFAEIGTDYVQKATQIIEAASSEQLQTLRKQIDGDKAVHYLKDSIANGQLNVWRIHNAQEVKVTPMILPSISIHGGTFLSLSNSTSDMNGAKLWVKKADLTNFMKAISKDVTKPTVKAETDCKPWLIEQFASDPDKQLSKEHFYVRAKSAFPGLSKRAFLRVWGSVACEYGRDEPGAKRKSQH
jgi:hypothetical protein